MSHHLVASSTLTRALACWPRVAIAALALAVLGCGAEPTPPAASGQAEQAAPSIDELQSLREILQHPEPIERVRRLTEILERSGPESLEEIKYQFMSAALDQGDVEYVLFATWWAQFDPDDAFDYAEHHLATEHPRVARDVVRAWAQLDPQAVLDSHALTTGDATHASLRGDLVDAFVVGWGNSGQPGLDEWVFAQTDSTASATAIKAWVRMRLLRDGFEETLAWTQEAPYDEEQRRILLANAIHLVAHQEPTLALEWLDRAEAAGVDTRTFRMRLANAWGHHDPEAAITWLRTFPDDLERKRAIAAVSKNWSRRNAAGMRTWLDAQEPDPVNDVLRYQWAYYYVRGEDYMVDWPYLLEQSRKMAEESMRIKLANWLLKRWYVVDEAAAVAWVDAEGGDIPQDVKDYMYQLAKHEREHVQRALKRQATKVSRSRAASPAASDEDRTESDSLDG